MSYFIAGMRILWLNWKYQRKWNSSAKSHKFQGKQSHHVIWISRKNTRKKIWSEKWRLIACTLREYSLLCKQDTNAQPSSSSMVFFSASSFAASPRVDDFWWIICECSVSNISYGWRRWKWTQRRSYSSHQWTFAWRRFHNLRARVFQLNATVNGWVKPIWITIQRIFRRRLQWLFLILGLRMGQVSSKRCHIKVWEFKRSKTNDCTHLPHFHRNLYYFNRI